ncbi:MAG: sulfotransferase, partial [Pirellulales bacterium]
MGRFRAWMVRQARGLFGVSQLHQQLRETNNLLRHVALSVSARHAFGASAGPTPGGDAAASLQSLAQGALFVVGCARSGTTILTRCLNSAPQIMLLEEPLFFLHEEVVDFAPFFNERHAAMGNRRQKGSFVAPAVTPECGPLGLLYRLHRDHKYVGEKAAFGPQEFPPDWWYRYLDFQSKYFLHARYILI